MSRITFFLGVFSIGLVAFLFFTGQFQGTPEEPLEGFDLEPLLPSDQNRVVHHSHDYSLGRWRYTLRGRIDLSSGVVLSPDTLIRQKDLLDVTIEMPVYGVDPGEPIDFINFEADRFVGDPGGDEAQVVGNLRAVSSSGKEELRTQDLRIRFIDGEDVRIDGSSPVQVNWPELQLYGASGLTGSLGSGSGLSSLQFLPPLIILKKGTADGAAGAAAQVGIDGTPGRQIRIQCDGPMTLSGSQEGARFEGGVYIYESDPEDSIDPTSSPPGRHIYSDYLDLQLESESRSLVKIESRAEKNPITIHLGGGIRVEGQQLQWEKHQQNVRLSGGVVIHSDLGNFEADEALVLTTQSKCTIRGDVKGGIRAPSISPGKVSDSDEEDVNWSVIADIAELEFQSGQLKDLVARGKPGQSVQIRELSEGGAIIDGDRMHWRPAEEQLEVLSEEGRRAIFTAGENRIEANSAALSVGSPRLQFRGGIRATLAELPGGSQSTLPGWLGEDSTSSIEAEGLVLTWDAQQRLKKLEAEAGEEPLRLVVDGDEPMELLGSRLEWRGLDGMVNIDGSGRQRLKLGSRADLQADRLHLSLVESQAVGTGSVQGTLRRSAADDEDPGVAVRCHQLVISLAGDETGAGESAAAGNSAAAAQVKPGGVVAVRALSLEGQQVEIDDGTILARSEELLWDALNQRYRFQGKGLQQVEVGRGGSAPDLIEAEMITLDRIEEVTQLVGSARIRMYLGNAGAAPSAAPQQATVGDKMAWNLTAERIDARLDLSQENDTSLYPTKLIDVVARDGVRLVQKEGGLEFRGQDCRWDQVHQRLVLSSEDGQGLQTFVRGADPRQDEVVAREVVVVRSTPAEEGAGERLEVLLSSVLSATVHLEPTAEDEVGKFDMRAEELLLVLREPLAGGTLSPHEVLAWGATDLRGGPYRILAERARVLVRNRSVELEGGEQQPVQVLRDGTSDLPPSRSVKMTWGPRGYRVQNLPRGGGWSLGEVDSVLERMDRKSHRPRQR